MYWRRKMHPWTRKVRKDPLHQHGTGVFLLEYSSLGRTGENFARFWFSMCAQVRFAHGWLRHRLRVHGLVISNRWLSMRYFRFLELFRWKSLILCAASWNFHCSFLIHWGRMTHICVSKIIIIGSDNGLSPSRRQAIIWTNTGKLLILTLGTNFSEIVSKIRVFSFRKMHLKMSSTK